MLLGHCARRVVSALPDLQLPALFAERGEPMLRRIEAIVEERAQPFV
ncbi:hypothetical protein FHR22_002054 [Sphingopyxis panaciterrae]|nr:hypothetical protein [Sphingopyxis panaciterrae]NIJ37370.1 hypothetical protein [Sphingopyxis panaciterrae]